MNILVVSRDSSVLDDASFGFPSHVTVETARDALHAELVLKEFQPDVVVVDLMTGNAGGYALAQLMGQLRAQQDVPILMLLEREQDAWLAKQSGATRYRTKPIAAETLASVALSLIS